MNKFHKKSRYAKKKRTVKNGKRTIRKKYKKRSRRTKSKGGGNSPSTAASTAESTAESTTASTEALDVEERAAPERGLLLPLTPEWSYEVPTESPYLSFFSKMYQNAKTNWRNFRNLAPESQQDKRVWKESVDRVMDKYNKLFEGNSIPKGTLLFHGSLDDSFDIFNAADPERPVFFGIEANISLWYIFEAAAREWFTSTRSGNAEEYFAKIRQHGYLYIYRTTKEIPENKIKIIPLLKDHPIDDSDCFGPKSSIPDMVCIHPQLAYHGFVDKAKLRDLSIELTLRPYQYKDSIEFVEQLRVNIMELYKNEENPDYLSLYSISDRRNTQDGAWQPISKEKE